jgi:hypothetical protein
MAWVYKLTPQEEALAARVGWERQLPMLGQPERNRNYSEGDIWEAWQHMICAASEIAAARILGMGDFEPHVNTFKNKLDIPGYEVRYSFTKNVPGYPKYSLRYKEGVDDPNEIYILIVGGPEEKTRRSKADGYASPAFRAIGWMYGRDCAKVQYLMPYGDNNYAVPAAELNEMSALPVRETASV